MTQCTLEHPSPVSVWLDVHAATPLEVRLDGNLLAARASSAAAGTRLTVQVPADASRIEIQRRDAPWADSVDLTIAWQPAPTWWSTVEATPKLEDKAIALRSVLETATGWSRLRALEQLRRAEYARDDIEESERIAERQIALAEELDAPAHQVYALAALTTMALDARERLPRVVGLVERLDALRESTPQAAMRADYAYGMVARATGDIDAALDHFRAARVRGEQLGETAALADVIGLEAATLAELGQVDEALALSERVRGLARAPSIHCETRLTILVNYAWAHIALRTRELPFEDPEPLMLEALALEDECGSAWDHSNTRIQLAINAIEADDPHGALGWLAQIERDEPTLVAWQEEAYRRAAAMVGDPKLQPSLLQPSPPALDPYLKWDQRVREADALRAWGFLALATQAYRDAEALLDARLETIRIDNGPELYLAGRRASAEGLVESLLERGRPAEALCAARLARNRELARLDRVARVRGASSAEQKVWREEALAIAKAQAELDAERTKLWELSDAQLQTAQPRIDEKQRQTRAKLDAALRTLGLGPAPGRCDALRRPEPGEVILTSAPVPSGRVVFASGREGIEFVELGDDGLDGLESLGEASRITIIELDSDSDTPLHARPWRGAASLLDLAPLAYSLDLPQRVSREGQGTRALLVADSRGDLAEARSEFEAVADGLQREGWRVQAYRGAEASRAMMLERMARVDLLHYAGHGVQEGMSGWDSALLLANDERLSVDDLFTLEAVPRGVVLTGCETGAMTEGTVGGGMNIGRAFVLSGADWVIAADTEVEDRHARVVGEALYGSGITEDGPSRLRRALLRLRTTHPDLPWQRFRVIVP